MNREDFVKRGKVKVDFLKFYRLVTRWACKTNDLSISDLELLFYLDPIVYFTVQDFKDGTFYYMWDKNRFYRIQREGWIERTWSASSKKGHHSRYKVSRKGNLLVQRIYRILIGQEDIPESANRNSLMKRKSYTDKVYSQAIKAFNRNKD